MGHVIFLTYLSVGEDDDTAAVFGVPSAAG